MITEKMINDYITSLGYIAATPGECARKINLLQPLGLIDLKFYVNPSRLCWFVDGEFLLTYQYSPEILDDVITVNLREIKLSHLGL